MYDWKDANAVGLEKSLMLPQFDIVGHEQHSKVINLSTGKGVRSLSHCVMPIVSQAGEQEPKSISMMNAADIDFTVRRGNERSFPR